MTAKKILMACSNFWTTCFQVGSHHLAREFLKLGYEVAFISDPISPFHILGGQELKERFRIYSSGGIRENHLWYYVPATLLPPNKFPGWVYRHWHQMTFPSVVAKAIENGFGEVDILYFDSPVQSFWLNSIRARKTLFRMADNSAGFRKSPAFLQLEEELTRKVDLVVCTAKNLTDKVHGPHVKHLPNGVPIAHFSKPSTLPEEYRSIPKPIAIYVGAIHYWFDYALIKKLAAELPEVSFVLIGPTKENPFQNLKNVHLFGSRPYSEVPNYLKYADVGMIPFDVERYPDLIHYVNPLKLYEYMACGLPVVSTKWEELETIDSPALLSRTAEEFKSHLLEALKHPKPKSFYQSYAEKQDWSVRGKQVIEWLQ